MILIGIERVAGTLDRVIPVEQALPGARKAVGTLDPMMQMGIRILVGARKTILTLNPVMLTKVPVGARKVAGTLDLVMQAGILLIGVGKAIGTEERMMSTRILL